MRFGDGFMDRGPEKPLMKVTGALSSKDESVCRELFSQAPVYLVFTTATWYARALSGQFMITVQFELLSSSLGASVFRINVYNLSIC